MYDLAIIGGGAAGMTAAIYAANANINTLIIERAVFGGQMTTAALIENFPSRTGIDGVVLSSDMKSQIDALGIDSLSDNVTSLTKNADGFTLITASKTIHSKSVIIANGVKRRRLNVKGEDRLSGRGVSWCAVCDGGFFKNKKVVVIGAGDSALKEALYLSTICNTVYLIYRRDHITAHDHSTQDISAAKNIVAMPNTIVQEICGDKRVDSIIVKNTITGSIQMINVSGVFEAVGLIPDNQKFANLVDLDENGYIVTDESCQTSAHGIFAAGDTRQKSLRQIVTACADGAICATNVREYLLSKSNQ